MKNIDPTKTAAWKKLDFLEIGEMEMKSQFKNNSERADDLKIEWQDFYVDFSKNRITTKTTSGLRILPKNVV